jgi:hypothetical protein
LGASILVLLFSVSVASAQTRRKVIINQDCSGPGWSNMQTLATLIQSPQVEVLGVTIVTATAKQPYVCGEPEKRVEQAPPLRSAN